MKKNTFGFTLAELILVVALVALMGTIALGMFFNSTKNLAFFSTFKNVQTTFRQARSFAITNATIGTTTPDRYGVYIEFDDTVNEYNVFMFADDGATNAFEYKLKDPDMDTVFVTKNYSFSKDDYDISVRNGYDDPIDFPLAFYYEKGSGDFQGFYTTAINPNATEPMDKTSANYILIYIRETESDGLAKTLVINQVSGLVEELT